MSERKVLNVSSLCFDRRELLANGLPFFPHLSGTMMYRNSTCFWLSSSSQDLGADHVSSFPPDFDPSKIKRRKMGKDPQQVIRLMAPFSMRCNRCGEYICESAT